MKKQNLLKKGFSLIELSIVILVIGILVIGITKGTAIMAKTRIGSARSLTAGSPVPLISDLVTWYEPTLASSFNPSDQFDTTTLVLSATNGGSWYDNSPNRSIHATTVTGAVSYRESSTNSIPGIRFPGGTGALAFNSISMNQKYYTIFVVENRAAATGDFLSVGGTGAANTFGYSATGTIGTATTGSATTGSGSVTDYSTAYSTPRIITFLSDATNKRVFVNGTVGGVTGAAGLITATSTGVIGNSVTGYTGEISEIILYNRGLKADERNDIQAYLSKKYGIKVTTSS